MYLYKKEKNESAVIKQNAEVRSAIYTWLKGLCRNTQNCFQINENLKISR